MGDARHLGAPAKLAETHPHCLLEEIAEAGTTQATGRRRLLLADVPRGVSVHEVHRGHQAGEAARAHASQREGFRRLPVTIQEDQEVEEERAHSRVPPRRLFQPLWANQLPDAQDLLPHLPAGCTRSLSRGNGEEAEPRHIAHDILVDHLGEEDEHDLARAGRGDAPAVRLPCRAQMDVSRVGDEGEILVVALHPAPEDDPQLQALMDVHGKRAGGPWLPHRNMQRIADPGRRGDLQVKQGPISSRCGLPGHLRHLAKYTAELAPCPMTPEGFSGRLDLSTATCERRRRQALRRRSRHLSAHPGRGALVATEQARATIGKEVKGVHPGRSRVDGALDG